MKLLQSLFHANALTSTRSLHIHTWCRHSLLHQGRPNLHRNPSIPCMPGRSQPFHCFLFRTSVPNQLLSPPTIVVYLPTCLPACLPAYLHACMQSHAAISSTTQPLTCFPITQPTTCPSLSVPRLRSSMHCRCTSVYKLLWSRSHKVACQLP